MKLKKKTVLYIALGIAVALLATLCVWMLVRIMNSHKEPNVTSSVSSKTFLDETSELSNQSEYEQNTEETFSSTPVVIVPAKNDTSSDSLPSEAVNPSEPLDMQPIEPPISTETANQEIIDYLDKSNFLMQYSLAKTQYSTQLNKDINEAKQQISYYSDKLNECAVNEAIAIKNLNEQMANAGLSNSGYYEQQLRRIKNNYQIEKNMYKNEINYYQEQVKYLQEQQTNPDTSEIKRIIAENTGMSSDEVSEKYDKYMQ